MVSLSRRLSPHKDGNHSSLSIDSISSSDAVIDSAANLDVTVHPFTTDNDNRGPSNSPHIASAFTVRNPINGISSPGKPSDSIHHGQHAVPSVQRDNQRPTQNKMAIDLILNSDPPSLDGSPEASAANHDSPAHVQQSGSATSTIYQASSCPCDPSGRILGNLNIILAQNREQIKITEKLIREVEARGSNRTSADQSIKSSIEPIDGFIEKNNTILQTLKSEIEKAKNRSAEIIQHQEQAAEAEKKAKRKPLKFMTDGTDSDVYGIPESFGKLVIVVGRRAVITQELINILRVAKASEKLSPSIWNGSRLRWLRPLLFPNVKEVVPTGWLEDDFPGLVRPCENLDPRIPGDHDADGHRMPVDSNEQIGIVLSRIGDLEDDDRREILQRCYGLEDTEVENILDENEHCLIRIYLGRSSEDDEELDDARDSDSDVIMEDNVGEAAINTFHNVNLPGYLDLIINACEGIKERHALKALAREIAFGYALLHWGARLDGRGIEFLLGSSPTGFGKRLYILDFKDCRTIGELTARCVLDQLVPAALGNDPHIPRATTWDNTKEQTWCKRSRKYVFTYRSHQAYAWRAFERYYLQASAKICKASEGDFDPCLPGLFIRELKMGFFEQDAEMYADGVSDRHLASEDGPHHQTEGYYAESEQGESSSQEDPEYGGDDEDDQSQDDRESFDDDQYGDDGYDSDAMDIDDSSEGEEDSDEDDDYFDDAD